MTSALIGRTEAGPLAIDLREPAHIGIQGQTRSGKSNLIYTLLAQLAPCDEALVVGVDISGLVLAPWIEAQ